MTAIEVAPVYALRRYTWSLLAANDPVTWDKSKYGGLTPIVPLNEEPELGEFAGPRIIYEYTHQSPGSMYFKGRGTVTYAIRDNNYRRLTKTMNILQVAFEREDESARDVNEFLDRIAKVPQAQVFDVSFGSIKLEFAESGTPEEEEAGMMVGIVTIGFEYFVEHNVNTRPTS